MRVTPEYEQVFPNSDGAFMLKAGLCYLGTHNEYVEGDDSLVMCIHGRSTVARYFVQVHQVAGFGDVGYKGHWTFELRAAYDTVIYVGMRIAQVSFHPVVGKVAETYGGRYTVMEATPKLPVPENF